MVSGRYKTKNEKKVVSSDGRRITREQAGDILGNNNNNNNNNPWDMPVCEDKLPTAVLAVFDRVGDHGVATKYAGRCGGNFRIP